MVSRMISASELVNSLLVQLPMRLALISSFHPFSFTKSANLLKGVDRSGVCGPLICGSSVSRSIEMCWSYSHPASAESRLAAAALSAASATGPRAVACRYDRMWPV